MADNKYREMTVRIPVAYYRELEHIAVEVHAMPCAEMVEKVIMTFVDNMREELYPRLEDITEEKTCQPTNTDVEAAKP